MRSKHSSLKAVCVASALLAGALGSTSAFAQRPSVTLDELGLSQAQFNALLDQSQKNASSPGIAFGSPVGFGSGWGEIGFALSGTTLGDNSSDDVDGSFGVVFGLGDPEKYVGLETTVNIISLRNSFGDDGNVGLKLHTTLPGSAAFAVGVDNIGRWGRAKQGSSSVYAVGTKIFFLAPSSSNSMPLSINVGLGDNRFNDVDHDGASVFGSLAFFPIRQLSLIADYSERSVNAGLSVAPFARIPVTATFGATNLTEKEQGGGKSGGQFGSDTEFAAALGYSLRF